MRTSFSGHKLADEIAKRHPTIKFLFDDEISWRNSFANRKDRKIFVGTKVKDKKNIVMVMLHEIGHLRSKRKSHLNDEKAAWKYAQFYAKKHSIPFNEKIMNDCINSYIFYYELAKKRAIELFGANNSKIELYADSFLKLAVSSWVNESAGQVGWETQDARLDVLTEISNSCKNLATKSGKNK